MEMLFEAAYVKRKRCLVLCSCGFDRAQRERERPRRQLNLMEHPRGRSASVHRTIFSCHGGTSHVKCHGAIFIMIILLFHFISFAHEHLHLPAA